MVKPRISSGLMKINNDMSAMDGNYDSIVIDLIGQLIKTAT
jgi:hypothetical protein